VSQLVLATGRQQAKNLTEIDTVSDFDQALRNRCERRFSGDFGGLLKLLRGAVRDVTPALLQGLPLDQANIEAGEAGLAEGGLFLPDDDVGLVVAALWPQFGNDFTEVVSAWAGRPGPVNRVVRGLAEAAKKGKI
jgi:hypothetical protein